MGPRKIYIRPRSDFDRLGFDQSLEDRKNVFCIYLAWLSYQLWPNGLLTPSSHPLPNSASATRCSTSPSFSRAERTDQPTSYLHRWSDVWNCHVGPKHGLYALLLPFLTKRAQLAAGGWRWLAFLELCHVSDKWFVRIQNFIWNIYIYM
jgi:hypothetical protein